MRTLQRRQRLTNIQILEDVAAHLHRHAQGRQRIDESRHPQRQLRRVLGPLPRVPTAAEVFKDLIELALRPLPSLAPHRREPLVDERVDLLDDFRGSPCVALRAGVDDDLWA